MTIGIRLAILAGLIVSTGFAAEEPALRCADLASCTVATVEWTGHFEPTLGSGVPAQCVVEDAMVCDRFQFFLKLPKGYWDANPGSLEVAIRWHTDSTDKDLDLFVFRNGREVARSAGQDSEAEVAFVESARNGWYQVYVVPVSLDEPRDYEGRIEIEAKPAVEPVRELLPNMVTFPPKTVAIASAEYLVDPVENPILPCYPEETLENEGMPTRCLRFDQIAANVGDGPLELRYVPDVAPTLRQIVHKSDGSTRELTAEESMELHVVHGHWHYSGFGYGKLYDSEGNEIARNDKTGFCLIEVDFQGWGAKGNSPRRFSFPGCQLPNDGSEVVQGIGPGWADVYNWFLADQFIDITNVPDGVYRLEIIADPDDTLLESNEDDNAGSSWVCIAGMDAKLVDGPTAACPVLEGGAP
jgi:hypothetical protein